MKELPILFNVEMVRAILRGAKTQTRRPVKKPHVLVYDGGDGVVRDVLRWTHSGYGMWQGMVEEDCAFWRCPYGVPGDHLYVREPFRFPSKLDKLSPKAVGEQAIEAGYPNPWCPARADADNAIWGDYNADDWGDWGKSRRAMHMPKWASRITLEVTEVRVVRVQDISEADAIAEGFKGEACDHRYADLGVCTDCMNTGYAEHPEQHFHYVWNDIYDNWADNPWVWAVSFKRVTS